jgi:hypothetical protein
MDRAKELSFGLDTVRRSAEFKLGMLARRTGILSLANWIKNGGRDRLTVSVPSSNGQGLVIEAVHSCDGEPAIPWDLVEPRGKFHFAACATAAYGKALHLQEGSFRVQVTPNPAILVRRGTEAPRIEVRLDARHESIDLASDKYTTVLVRPGRAPMLETAKHKPHLNGKAAAHHFTRAQRAFIEDVKARRLTTATVFVPRWLGVTASTRVLFDGAAAFYPVPPKATDSPWEVTDAQIEQHADALAASGVNRVIFSGGDEIHHRLMFALRERDASIRFDVVFHGNFVQLQDQYHWKIFNLWIDASRAGILHTFVTVKKGAEEVLRSMGVRSEVLLNYIPGPTAPPPALPLSPPRFGIWTSGTCFKSVNPMLAALKLIPGATLHAAGIGEQGLAMASRFELPCGFTAELPVKRDELMRRICDTHVSLYVTTAECSPMLPLESLQLGVPCLIGPCSHLFEDDRYLFDRLVVPFPDRPDVIAKYARKALEEREQIIDAWARYAPAHNERAQAMVRSFLAGHEATASPYIEPSPLRPITVVQEGDA